MFSVHALMGIGEGLLTVAVVGVLKGAQRVWQANEKSFAMSLFGLVVLAVLMSPMASSYPDGLEWVAGRLSFVQFKGLEMPALFPDYQVSMISDASAATMFAGIIGVCIVFACTFVAGKLLKPTNA